MDIESLTRKLGHIAEEHNVKFELPIDFMRFTPISSAKNRKNNDESDGNTVEFDLPKDFMKFTPLTVGSKRQVREDDKAIEYDLPKDFMRFTPMTEPLPKRRTISPSPEYDLPKGFMRFTPMTEPRTKKAASPDDEIKYDLPKDFMKFTPVPNSLKKQSSSTDGMAYELPKDFMKFTPTTVVSKRSIPTPQEEENDLPKGPMRFTPIADAKNQQASSGKECDYELPHDFMRFTPMSSIGKVDKSVLKSALNSLTKSVKLSAGDICAREHISSEVDNLRNVGHAVQGLADMLEAVVSAKKDSSQKPAKKTPGARIAIVEGGERNSVPSEGKEAGKVLFRNTLEEDVEQENDKKAVLQLHKAALVQARSFRSQAMLFSKHLKRSSLKARKLRSVANTLAERVKIEKARRIELQNALKQLIQQREEEEKNISGNTSDAEACSPQGKRVIVVGYTEPQKTSNTFMAGNVVVVKQNFPREQPTPSTTLKTSANPPASVRTLKKTVRKTAQGEEVEFTLDEVKVPGWIFDEERHTDGQIERVSDDMEEDEKPEALEDSETENEEVQDVCHVCKVGDDGDVLLLCDSCDNACHLACCKPPRKRVPKGDWFCNECKTKSQKDGSKKTCGTKRKAAEAPKARQGKSKENISTQASVKGKEPTKARSVATRRTRSTRAC